MLRSVINFEIKWQAAKGIAIARIYLIMAFFICAFAGIDLRLLMISTAKNFQSHSYERANYYRKDIVDRNGAVVATSLPIYSVFANPKKISNKKQTLEKLAKAIKINNKNKVLADLESDKNFVWIKHEVTPKEEQLINSLGLSGIGLEKSFKRVYAYGNLMSHLLGYVSRDNKGLAGIERFFEHELLVTQDSLPPEPDRPEKKLELTLDTRIQEIVSDELDSAISQFSAKGAAAIVVSPDTGEILAMVSKPDFEPHNPGSASQDQLFNKASMGAY
jgi:cell division protein FtsI (penicillin-binding protein 3)